MSSAVELLDAVLDFFGPKGRRWTHHRFEAGGGRRCLISALREQGQKLEVPGNEALRYLCAALPENYFAPARRRYWVSSGFLMHFNDSCRGFAQVREFILKARRMAELAERSTLARKALITDLNEDRHGARWLTMDTYILVPKGSPERERLAA